MLTTLLHFNQCYQSTFQGGKHFPDKPAAKNGIGIEPQQLEEPEPTLEDEFYLELGKNGLGFVQGEVSAKMEDPGLFTLPCRLEDSKPFDALADLGSCVNIIPLYLFKKLNIGLLEETDHIFGLADGTKSYPKDPETRLLVGRGFLATVNAVIDCRMAKIAVGEGITSPTTIASDTSSEEPIRVTPGMVSHIDDIVQSVSIQDKPSSYVGAAGGLTPEPSKTKVNFRSLYSENLCEGVDYSIPRKVVETVSTRFANTLYGYFIGKRIAFPVIEYDVRNNLGLEDVLENGPWMIRNSLIILKKWSMNTHLCKEELTHIPVWVKIHDVPIQVFSEDGLSIIASQIGKPILLDSYTSSMCIESWGRSSFSGYLIEINVGDFLKESLIVGVPLIEGSGFTIETINIEYE
ncbi:zinc knuckle CX2CX4HX4C containing protein [Tanacetum coccineum]